MDLTDETEVNQPFLGKAGVDQAIEIVVQLLCIKLFVISVESPARYLFAQLLASQYIAMFASEIKKKLKIIEGVIDFRGKILIVIILPSKLILMS